MFGLLSAIIAFLLIYIWNLPVISIIFLYMPILFALAYLHHLLGFSDDDNSTKTQENTPENKNTPESIEKALKAEENRKQELLSKRMKLVPEHYLKKFLQHAERNYSKVDKYGNLNTGSLEKEIADYLLMISKQSGDFHQINMAKAHAQGKTYPSLNEDYRWLKSYLRDAFIEFHKKKKKEIQEGTDISRMTGVEFERYLAGIFKSAGYHVEMTPASGDQGADLIAEKDDRRMVIQAKRYKGNVGNSAVQEVIGAISYYNGTEGWVITNSFFTNSAIDLAKANNINLIDGSLLDDIRSYI